MNINNPQIDKILSIESDNDIIDNKLLILSLSINTGKVSVLKKISEELKIEKEELTILINLLSKENILNKNDLKMISKLEGTKLIEKENLEHMVEEIINHLNAITHTKRRVTESRKNMILRWLKQGYTIEDFVNVNLLFYYKWNEDPNMEQYIRPETLYNKKFIERSEEANKEFKKIKIYELNIKNICKTYMFFFENLIVNPSLKYQTEIKFIENTNDLCKYIPFELQQRIAFWLKKGFSVEDILMTIELTIKQWSKKIELYPYINLKKIMDRKFPERVSVAKKTLTANKMKLEHKEINELEAWAKEG